MSLKKMLDETKSELKSDTTSFRMEVKAGFQGVDAKFNEVGARFDKIESSISEVKSEVSKIYSVVHSMKAMMEEQSNQNRYVLDGLMNVTQRQDGFEKDLTERVEGVEDVISKGPRGI